jgi:hypothetical protein
MIQRMQTIYFLIAALLIGSLLFVPFVEIVSVMGEAYRFDSGGFYSEGVQNPKMLFGSFPIILLCIISIILIMTTIFQYRYRTRQIIFSKWIILILLALLAIICFDIWRCINLVPGSHELKIYILFPIIAVVLIYMAIKAIIKDEKLLKSANRIR